TENTVAGEFLPQSSAQDEDLPPNSSLLARSLVPAFAHFELDTVPMTETLISG
ncbi:unnamed protein product, partial [marine sediment metagenome]